MQEKCGCSTGPVLCAGYGGGTFDCRRSYSCCSIFLVQVLLRRMIPTPISVHAQQTRYPGLAAGSAFCMTRTQCLLCMNEVGPRCRKKTRSLIESLNGTSAMVLSWLVVLSLECMSGWLRSARLQDGPGPSGARLQLLRVQEPQQGIHPPPAAYSRNAGQRVAGGTQQPLVAAVLWGDTRCDTDRPAAAAHCLVQAAAGAGRAAAARALVAGAGRTAAARALAPGAGLICFQVFVAKVATACLLRYGTLVSEAMLFCHVPFETCYMHVHVMSVYSVYRQKGDA